MLKNKRVLITAGPTWVPIDDVRVISNTATGETGLFLAKEARQRKAHVTLLLGQGAVHEKRIRGVAFKPFCYFDDLQSSLRKILKQSRFDVVIQAAAVSDYKVRKVSRHKISSHKKRLRLELIPTPKLISLVKEIQPCTILVGFKYEQGLSARALIHEARILMRSSCAHLVVANTRKKGMYSAYIIGNNGFISQEIHSKAVLARTLFNVCEQIIG
ncbi:MAG TPA: phosphopantothenoylcysteine decarboxylase [Candidatus Omnitrophota bacterium]|nr:phosphopantothenoylcysteine decarboxylase [Candidatus Omnitrophota bacterium]